MSLLGLARLVVNIFRRFQELSFSPEEHARVVVCIGQKFSITLCSLVLSIGLFGAHRVVHSFDHKACRPESSGFSPLAKCL